MKSSSIKSIEVTLILNEIEARWLENIMQNPLHGQSIDNESQTDKTMRNIFWSTLTKEGI